MQRRWIAGLILVLFAARAQAAGAPDEMQVKTADGRVLGVLLFCNDCKSAGKGCLTGAEEGWLSGKPCGKCMVENNHDIILKYPVDIHITGKLVDASGKPVKERFVKLFLPNGWGVRTKTYDEGNFRLMLGATTERESKQPLLVDVGTRVDSIKGTDPYYAMFLMPETYKPCSASAEKPAKKDNAPAQKQKPQDKKAGAAQPS
jgi:hypothetical protein